MRAYVMSFISLNRSLRFALIAFGLACFAYVGVAGVLQNLYLLRLGYGADAIGVISGVYQFTWAAASFPASVFARQRGTRTALLSAYMVFGTAYVLFLSNEALPREGRFAWLVACSMALGVGAALTSTSIFPYLMAMASEAERLHAFALQRLSATVPALLGSLLSGTLASWLAVVMPAGDPAAPYRTVLWLVVMAEYAAALCMLPARHAESVAPAIAGKPVNSVPLQAFGGVAVISLLMGIGDGSARSFFNVYMDRAFGADVAQIGIVASLTSLLSIAAAFGSASMLAKLGAHRAVAYCMAGMALGLAVIAVAPVWPVAGIGYIAMMTMASINTASRNLLGQELAPVHARTTMAAVISVGMAGGTGLAAAAGGYLVGLINFSGMFATAGALSLLTIPIVLRLRAAPAPQPAVAAAPVAAGK